MEYAINLQLKNLRRKRNITQKELADMIGISFQTISKWETGTCLPDVNHLPVLSNFFNVSIEELLGTDTRTPTEQLYEIGELLLNLCIKACNYGLLAVEREVNEHQSGFLKYGIKLLLELPEKADMIMRNKLKYSGYPTSMFVYNSMITDIISVWMTNSHPFVFSNIILSYFTDEQAEEFKTRNRLFFPTYESFCESIKGKEPLSKKTKLLEMLIEPDKTVVIQDKLRQSFTLYDNSINIGFAIKGSSENIIRLFIDNLTLDKLKERVMFDYNIASEYEPIIIQNQEKLLEYFV